MKPPLGNRFAIVQTKARRPSASGFTLIELVISAALMSMILGAAYACFRSSVSSQKLVDTRAEIFQNARVALALMSADLRSARALSKDFELVGMHREIGEVTADNIDFATSYTPRRPHEADFCETSYFLERDRESGRLALWRRRDATPDDEPLAGGTREEIATGVIGLSFEYYDGFEWFDEWGDAEGSRKKQTSVLEQPNLFGMPEAVRITLWFDSNPSSNRSARERSVRGESSDATEEPPLVFQTVVRLNLAGVAQSSGSSANRGDSSGTPAPPAGGNP